MKVTGSVLLLVLIFASCGGSPDTWGRGAARFVNRTSLAEAEFQQMAEIKWKLAQENIATKISYDLSGNVVSQPDPAALEIQPSNVVVSGTSEVLASELNSSPNCIHCPYTDPSGIIPCPSNSAGARYCDAYLENFCTIIVPASKPQNMGPYEMENCVLKALRRNIDNR